jgi:DNA replication initiation complex subunit (GINS family)
MSVHGGAMANQSADTSTTENIKVEKATGTNAYTVAEIFGKKSELDKKNVVVSGKVVKVSAGIMGKNWLHIQDGSGNAKDGNNDLVVTTQDIPKVGDIVTANGTLYKDKDFGSGYKYDVIIEEATIKK